MKKQVFIFATFISTVAAGQEDAVNKSLIAGNEFYRQQKYEQAVNEYSKALAIDPANAEAKYNYANALYRAGKQVESTKNFTELATIVSDKALRSKVYYNKGVILSNQNNIEESVEAYKNALRQDPSDMQARENLQKALLELKKKTPPPPKKQNDKKQEKEKQQQKQSKSKMNQREAEQRLQLLAQKEKEVQQRLQKEKQRTGGGQGKDW